MSDVNFKTNVTSDAFWLRTIYTVIFIFVIRMLDLVLLLSTLVQWVSRLLTGRPQKELGKFCQSLGIYYQQVVYYLTGCNDDKPFPFREWPVVVVPEDEPDTVVEPASSDASNKETP
ncbi:MULTISPECIES: DUF4389 domain-containing protein [unclassified Oceanobacter]|uniref:DUF4389 domain-containing protein n=1 Tax=unclassified Oceanobacter TaxID=2620260 RepID=UPI002732A088|nr:MULTISPECIES: DUF4389 domain-containing protein [unclassified Oceanobacter]MDP2608516.1 DUF4389 domain-containing protein [Oceanobacter sp. 1_MG-2023]MDP2611722.1 DUF4389 domain-containing protein [Oceanobacter sp. 2_MG-2023]